MTLRELDPPPKARVWWNGEAWEAYVPGDQYTFVDPHWEHAWNWAELGMAFKNVWRG